MQGNTQKRLTLQDYITFYSDCCADNLTISQLKQILSIHGFMQLGNSRKEDIMDAVRSLHMIPPIRSTINTNLVPLISLHVASLSVQEVTQDLRNIGWEEFPVQYINKIEPKVPSMSLSLQVEQVPETAGKLQEKDKGGPLICALPSLKFSKKARTVMKKHADKYSWRFSGHMNISGLSHKSSKKVRTVMKKHADKYSWRFSGCMNISGLPYKRRYYKCCNAGCYAKKHIDRDANDPSLLTATYKGEHNHEPA